MSRLRLALACVLVLWGGGVWLHAASVQVQKVNYVTTAQATSHVINWSPTPTNGNLLGMCIVSDNTITTPAGWSVAVSAPDFTENEIIYKVAASEASSVTVTTLIGHVAITAFEYSGMTASPFDVATSATAQAQNISTGTTATLAQASELAIACAGISGATPAVGTGWNNSFSSESDNVTSGTGTLVRGVTASLVVSATTALTTTLNMASSGNSHNVGLIATFKIAAGGGAACTPTLTLLGVGRC